MLVILFTPASYHSPSFNSPYRHLRAARPAGDGVPAALVLCFLCFFFFYFVYEALCCDIVAILPAAAGNTWMARLCLVNQQ